MPANRNRNNRGYGRNMGGPPPFASSGPLRTDDLELRELDLELALLKRKREMIEQQHTMLVNDTPFGGSSQYGFNQGPSYGQRSEPTRNFANLYNDPPGSQYNNRFNTQQGMKRPAIDPWDNSSPPKRFNAPSGSKRPATRYEPREPRQPARFQSASQPRPLMSSSFRSRRPAPPTRNNFKPTKVTKPRQNQNQTPNKLKSQPVAERKDLVAKASGLVEKVPESFVLEADKPPHPKLLGRLELGLGKVLKEMRDTYGAVEPHVVTFTHMSGQRALKQAIRERIRTVMLGKAVGGAAEIVEFYRKEHPKDTDIELLEKAREAFLHKGNYAIDIIKEGNPERYFRSNFRRLLDASLQKMFERVELLYNKVEDSDKPLQEIIDEMIKDINDSQQDIKEDSVETAVTNDVNEKTESPPNLATENIETETLASETPAENGDNAKETAAKANEENEKQPDENAGKAEKVTEKPFKKPLKKVAKRPFSNEEFIRAKFYGRLMDTMLKRSLPTVLPKYKEFITRIVNTDKAFKETKAFLTKSTNEMVDEIANNPSRSQGAKTKLFVKIVGRPTLPKKKLMKAFLDTFHPTLVKRHRSMHNILFVAFDSQENVDNIIAKNDTSIADCRLDIRISEKLNKNKEPAAVTNDQKDTKANNSDVEIIEPAEDDVVKLDESLDSQINDLLSSIRKEEDDEGDDKKAVNENDLETVQEDAEDNPEAENEMEFEANNETEPKAENGTEPESENVANGDKAQNVAAPSAAQKVGAVNEAPAKGTPTRSSIRTRRASKLGQ